MSRENQKQEWERDLLHLKMGQQLDMNTYDEEGNPIEYINAVRVPGGFLMTILLETENHITSEMQAHVTTTFVPNVVALNSN